ncbi:MAG: AAA family ATPase [Alphaproteobacteria bacterium]|nr:AAA family ATPase [Alphaproteobacteria bacterium]
MQFTKLRLAGFKSFVEATELWIEPGLTGIVGPNGCGKSNLVEALRWVMGETSPRNVRGSGMEDVIFGGTDSRPARNIAEVTLAVDNADRAAPAQFNSHDELDITRRIERGNGSAYRINGADVRARDVQLLFADAASGARSTALVSQGRIGEIISAKPTDRRHLLEEAAGITGLHSRRHEAELRLRAAETNLERLDDVIGALEEQLKGLKKQARQATRYRNLSDHIRRAEAIALHHQWREATAARAEAAAKLAEIETAVGEITREVASASVKQTDAAAGVPALREAEAREAAALQRLLLARDGLEAEEQRIAARQAEIAARLQQIAADAEREGALKADAAAAVTALDEEAAAIRDAQASEESDLAGADDILSQANAEVSRIEQELTRLTGKIASDEARRDGLRRQIQDMENRRARIARRLEEIGRERGQAEAEIAAAGAIDEVSAEARAAREALDAARAALEEAEAARAAAAEEEQKTRDAMREAQGAADRLHAEEEALTELLTVGDPDLWPPMIDALSVEPGWELALASALGDDLNAAADEAAPVHWRALPPFPSPAPLPAGARPLAEMVHAPAALSRRLSQVGVVDDDAQGRALAPQLAQGQRLATRSGGLWRWDGFTATGEGADAGARRLAQRNRLKEVGVEREGADRILAQVRAAFEAAGGKAEETKAGERAARDAARQADAACQKARDTEAALNQKSAQARSKLAALAQTAQDLHADDAELAQGLERAQADLDSVGDIDAARGRADEVRGALGEARVAARERQTEHDRLIREAGSRRQRLDDIEKELASWRRRAETAERQIAELGERQAAAQAESEQLSSRPAEIAEQRAALFDQIAAAEATRTRAADALAEAEATLEAIGRALRATESRLSDAREERVRCQGHVEQVDQTLAALAERARERLDCAPEAALASAEVEDDDRLPDRQDVEARLERLKRERDTMGPVNLRAEAESEELDERISTMLSERDDLTAAIARLRQGIASLNREGRQRLLDAFKTVDSHFQTLFGRLFGGGKAHLALTEAEDPLDAGLEIFASPPGKKLQNMTLLSGGEQALTAMSLLFAVFLTNPAPICVLDEVDAPLDDANVERFCRLLTEMADQSQTRFLVVTHHRLTMARMDRLFGVTMGERGVSQLVSVDLQVAERLRESA